MRVSGECLRCLAVAAVACMVLAGQDVAPVSRLVAGDCGVESRLPHGWRRLDEDAGHRFAITDMKPGERIRGVIVPRGRYVVHVECSVLRGSYSDWYHQAKDELTLAREAKGRKRDILIGRATRSADFFEVIWANGDLRSAYWLLGFDRFAIVIHAFGWNVDGAERVDAVVANLLKDAAIVARK